VSSGLTGMFDCCGAGDGVGIAVDAIERLCAEISLRKWLTVSSNISAFSSLDLVFPHTKFFSSSRWLFIRSLRLFSMMGFKTLLLLSFGGIPTDPLGFMMK